MLTAQWQKDQTMAKHCFTCPNYLKYDKMWQIYGYIYGNIKIVGMAKDMETMPALAFVQIVFFVNNIH